MGTVKEFYGKKCGTYKGFIRCIYRIRPGKCPVLFRYGTATSPVLLPNFYRVRTFLYGSVQVNLAFFVCENGSVRFYTLIRHIELSLYPTV